MVVSMVLKGREWRFVMARFKVSLLLGLLLFCAAAECAKLNTPRVLIPLFNKFEVNFTLEVTDGGCYQWSSSRNDVITVVPSGDGCSSSALVKPVPRLHHRHTAIILAKDVQTQQVLRCDVIVDYITRLELMTKTRELFVEEAPEAFEIRAYDNQGNEFTTLEGVVFNWKLFSSLVHDDVIRFMKFSKSLYEASNSLLELESRGYHGHTALLEGVRTGSTRVRVFIPQPEYVLVECVEVVLRVVANLLIEPGDITIMIGDSVYFTIIQVQGATMIEIPQPSHHYWLQAKDPSVAKLNVATGLAVGQELGSTQVQLIGKDDTHLPSATLRVVEAYEIQLTYDSVQINNDWSMQVGQSALLVVHILDSEKHRIHIGPNTRVLIKHNEELFTAHWRSDNGTVVIGQAKSGGVTEVTATLLSIEGKKNERVLGISTRLSIFEPIRVIPSSVILPWSPDSVFRHEVQLWAVGGNNDYVWRCDGDVAAVTHSGMLRAILPGTTTVTATMSRNSQIFGTASVVVVEPEQMEVVSYTAEGLVDERLPVYVALYTTALPLPHPLVPYTNCDKLPFKITTVEGVDIELVERNPDSVKEEPAGEACTVLYVRCKSEGTAIVQLQLGQLSQLMTIACYTALRRLHPPPLKELLLLAVGSSANIIFTGGPHSWAGGSRVKKEAFMDNPTIASIKPYTGEVAQHHLHVYTITCLKIGATQMQIKVIGNGMPASDTLGVDCGIPDRIYVYLHKAQHTKCRETHISMLSKGGPVEVVIKAVDSRDHEFYNISSMYAHWSCSVPDFMRVGPEQFLDRLDPEFSPVPIKSYQYQMLFILEENFADGVEFNVVMELSGMPKHKSSSMMFIKHFSPPHVIDEITVFLHSSPLLVEIEDGSGIFRVNHSESSVAHVQLEGARTLYIKPFSEGRVSFTVEDMCIESPPIRVQILVVVVARVVAYIPDLVEKNNQVECTVHLLNRDGTELDAAAVGAPIIMHRILEGHVVIKPKSTAGEYTVTGLVEGDVVLEFQVANATGIARTRVFPPLRVVPRTPVLLPGGVLALSVLGGPSTTVKYYSTSTQSVLKVSSIGVLEGLSVGTAIIEARAISASSTVLARATANVRVVVLAGVKIHAPTRTLLTGNTMPLWVNGLPEVISPLELGALRPALHFRWTVVGAGSARISHVLGDTHIKLEDTDFVAVQLTALKPGRIIIGVEVKAERGGEIWNGRMEMDLLPKLLLNPPHITPLTLLLEPHSYTELGTTFAGEDIIYSVLPEPASPLVKVSLDGKVTSLGRLGHSIINISTTNPSTPQQIITLGVEVCPVHYTMLHLSGGTGPYSPSGQLTLPEGLKLRLSASRHDSRGRRLASQATGLHLFSNRPDLHTYKTHPLYIEVSLTEPGRSVLHLTDTSTDKHFSDYVAYAVQSVTSPRQVAATVGDVWCMGSVLWANVSTWKSNDPKVVSVTSRGLAQVRASQPTPTSLMLVSTVISLAAKTPVSTKAAYRITFLDVESEHVVTNEKPYVIPLVLASREEPDKLSNLIFHDTSCLKGELSFFPFSCHVKSSNGPPVSELTVAPIFDKTLGRYGCRVMWSTSTPDMNTNSSVTVTAKMDQGVTDTVSVRTIRTVRTIPASPVALALSPTSEVAVLGVIAPTDALNQLTVTSENNVVEVESVVRVSDTEANYNLRAGRGSRGVHSTTLHLLSPLTHQDIELVVVLGEAGVTGACAVETGWPLLQLLYSQQFAVLLAVTFLVLLISVIYVYNNYYPVHHTLTTKDDSAFLSPADISSQIRSLPYSSRSPLSHSPLAASSPAPPLSHGAGNADTSSGGVYGDPSFLASPDRRRNRRFL